MNATATTKTAPAIIDLDAYLASLRYPLSRVAVVEQVDSGAVVGVWAESAHGTATVEKGLVAVYNHKLTTYTDSPDGSPRWTADASAVPSKVYRARWLKAKWM